MMKIEKKISQCLVMLMTFTIGFYSSFYKEVPSEIIKDEGEPTTTSGNPSCNC